jgi:methylmalonyl-CoA mutase N-terminal domain/subunit
MDHAPVCRFRSARESNQRYHYLIQRGQTGLSVAFDLPTQIGYDADHPLALGEVGKVGVSISSLAGYAHPACAASPWTRSALV